MSSSRALISFALSVADFDARRDMAMTLLRFQEMGWWKGWVEPWVCSFSLFRPGGGSFVYSGIMRLSCVCLSIVLDYCVFFLFRVCVRVSMFEWWLEKESNPIHVNICTYIPYIL